MNQRTGGIFNIFNNLWNKSGALCNVPECIFVLLTDRGEKINPLESLKDAKWQAVGKQTVKFQQNGRYVLQSSGPWTELTVDYPFLLVLNVIWGWTATILYPTGPQDCFYSTVQIINIYHGIRSISLGDGEMLSEQIILSIYLDNTEDT